VWLCGIIFMGQLAGYGFSKQDILESLHMLTCQPNDQKAQSNEKGEYIIR
jgi:hypothetical protein